MITIRSLIAGLMATLLAVISVATFLLVYFASLDSVESLTTLSVQTASDRIAGQISTTLLDRVTNPLVAVARAARVRSFTTPKDDPFSQNASSPDRFAWHGEWRTLFDDIVSGCPSCIMSMRFVDGSYGASFPVPNQPYRYHQFSRSLNGTDNTTPTEDFYDSVTYKLTLQTFDEVVESSATIFKPSLETRVDSATWRRIVSRVNSQGLALPASVPGVWSGADLTPAITEFGLSREVSFRADVIIANSAEKIAIVSVYVPLRDIMSSAEATVPTVNSRVFAINEIGIVTEVGRTADINARIQPSLCSEPAQTGCLPSISDMNFEALTISTNDNAFFETCKPVRDTTTTGRAVRVSSKFSTDSGDVYFASPRCVDTPLDLSSLRVITLIPQDDINADLTTGRDISIGIVVAFFFISLVFGYCFVWYLLKPFEVIAQRMKKAALLADNAPRSESSCLEEIARLQLAYETMNDELLRLKGFVPQSVLQLDMLDDSGSGKGGPGGAYMVGGDAGDANGRDGTAVEMNGMAGVPGSSSALFRRAHIMAERLSVSVASIQRSRVAVCVMNLRNFHGAIADMTTEDLSIAVKQIVRIISDATADHRGVVDFFHGDHYILTYGAARACQFPTKSAIATSLRVAYNLTQDPIIKQMTRLGVPYSSSAANEDKSNMDSNNGNELINNNQGGNNRNNNQQQQPITPQKLILSVGISAGDATVGSFGSTELKRFCTIGPCYSQAFEIELVLKDSPQLRKSSNQLSHSIGVPHWMFNHVFQSHRLEAVAMGLVTKTKTGIARVLAPVPPQNQMPQDVLFGQAATPREGGNTPGGDGFGNNNTEGPIEENGYTANSKGALEAFIDICNSEEAGAEEKALNRLRPRDAGTAGVIENIVANYASEVSVNASPNEAQEEDVLHEAFASEEDWLDDGPQQGNKDEENNNGEATTTTATTAAKPQQQQNSSNNAE